MGASDEFDLVSGDYGLWPVNASGCANKNFVTLMEKLFIQFSVLVHSIWKFDWRKKAGSASQQNRFEFLH